MGVLSFLFEPFVFYTLLAIFVFGAIYIIFSTSGKSPDEQQANQRLGIDTGFLEIGAQKTEQESAEIKKDLRDKEEELKNLSREKEEQLRERQRLEAAIATLETQLKKKEEALKKESSGRQELQKKIKILEDELGDLKTDLSLKSQMYNGLKGQYEELEQTMIRSGTKQETQDKPSGKEKDLLSKIENPEENQG